MSVTQAQHLVNYINVEFTSPDEEGGQSLNVGGVLAFIEKQYRPSIPRTGEDDDGLRFVLRGMGKGKRDGFLFGIRFTDGSAFLLASKPLDEEGNRRVSEYKAYDTATAAFAALALTAKKWGIATEKDFETLELLRAAAALGLTPDELFTSTTRETTA